MISVESPYLMRLGERRYKKALWANVIFGLSLGWLLTVIGGFRYYFLLEGAWLWILLAGLICLGTTVLLPVLMGYPRRLLQFAGARVTEVVGQVVTSIIYFVIVVPSGMILQLIRGTHPFYRWRTDCTLPIEGWTKKPEVLHDESASSSKITRTPLLLQTVEVVVYFMRRGDMILLPSLILIMVAALVGIFVQNASVVPMLYPLF